MSPPRWRASAAQQHAVAGQRPTPSSRVCSCPATTQGGADNGWSLGDLLHRASQEDDGTHRSGAPSINTDVIARALDATTASAIWSRFRAGQRGIMVRSIYTEEGRATFDDIIERYKADLPFQRMIDRFLHDFEQMLRNVEQKDPSGAACTTT